MIELVFATGNANKLKEVSTMLAGAMSIIGLNDIGFTEDIPEPHDTLEENALEKARYIHERYEKNCFSEDTGLEVYVLKGEPGVYSARYAGEDRDPVKNMNLLLKNLEGKSNRKARFRTVVALILNGRTSLFEGIVEGKIILERRGKNGFGYDPIFVPDGYDQSFAELNQDIKNNISHRANAIEKLVRHLKNL